METSAAKELEQADQLFQQRAYAQALDRYASAAQMARDEFNRSVELESLSQQARIHLVLNQREDGESVLAKAAALVEVTDAMGYSRYLGVKGRYEWRGGNLEEARKTFDEYYTFCSLQSLWARAIDAANMSAIVAEKPEEQIQWSKRGIEIAEKQEADSMLGPLWNNLGATFFDMGHYDGALVCFEQAREYHWRFSQERVKLTADYQIGMTLRALGRHDEALTWLRPSLAWAERLNDRDLIGQICHDLGEAEIGLGRAAAGLSLLKRAYQEYQAADYQKSSPEILENLAKRMRQLEGPSIR